PPYRRDQARADRGDRPRHARQARSAASGGAGVSRPSGRYGTLKRCQLPCGWPSMPGRLPGFTESAGVSTASPGRVDLRVLARLEEASLMHTKIQEIEKANLRSDVPDFRPGDTLEVHVRVVEGNRSRVQVFKGFVLRRQGGGSRETFTVRKVSYGVGVERTFPVHSPVIDKIVVAARGDVRRAKLYYMRDLRGKAARIREKRETSAK